MGTRSRLTPKQKVLRRAAELLREHAGMVRNSETDSSGPHKGQITDRFALQEVLENERIANELEAMDDAVRKLR